MKTFFLKKGAKSLPWAHSLYIGKLPLKLTVNYDFSVFSMEDWFKFVQTEIMVDWLLVIGLIGLDGFSSYQLIPYAKWSEIGDASSQQLFEGHYS